MNGFAYNAAGNLLQTGTTALTWDAESRLTSAGGASYMYDAFGERVESNGIAATGTVYFGGRPIARYSGGQWTDLIYGPNGLIAEVAGSENAEPRCRVVDPLGTLVGTMTSKKLLTNPMDYTPFGQVFSGNTNDPYFFTGKERDIESGLDYFGARYMSSAMGRFMSPDLSDVTYPVPYADLTNPQSRNLYAYLGNNPLSDVDDDGHDGASPTATCQGALSFLRRFLNLSHGGGGSGGNGGDGTKQDVPTEPGSLAFNTFGPLSAKTWHNSYRSVEIATMYTAGTTAIPMGIAAGAGGGVATLGLNEFGAGEVETVVESGVRPASSQVSQGATALAKKFGHAQSGGFRPAFEGMEGGNPTDIIRGVMRNPSRVFRGSRTTDIYDAAGRGVQIDSLSHRLLAS